MVPALLIIWSLGCGIVTITKEEPTWNDGASCVANSCTDPSSCYDGTSAYTLPVGYQLKTNGTWSCNTYAFPVQQPFYFQIDSLSNVTNDGGTGDIAKDAMDDLARGGDSWTYPQIKPAIIWLFSEAYSIPDDTYFPTTGDGASDIVMHNGAWTKDANVLASTQCQTSGAEWCCQFTECDTTIYTEYLDSNGVRQAIKWSHSEAPGSTYFSLSYTLAHELGHALGLAHQDTATFPGTLMSRTQTSGTPWQNASSDDIAAVDYIYGTQ